MLEKKNIDSYVKELAKKHGLKKSQVKTILKLGMNNIVDMINKGEDIQLQHFGSFYFEKRSYANYLKTKRKNSEQKFNQSQANGGLGKFNQ